MWDIHIACIHYTEKCFAGEKLNLNKDKLEIPFHITEQFFAFKNISKTGFFKNDISFCVFKISLKT